ncbi:PepSY domain-containing protein [Halobacillus salinus]|uniref:PepSY domain-containing protein n=1 Tax=Halobacillus salinus TaxID=192814 RepID=UPI0009A7672E|nr:PepSY domain-containing protein [Halobacillus salinus]
MNGKIVIGAGAIVLAVLVLWQGWSLWVGPSAVTADQVKEQVQSQYNGEVLGMEETDDYYLVSLQLDTGDYAIEVSKESGEIVRMTRQSTQEENSDSSTEEPSGQPITEQEAAEIALGEVEGELDDVDYESSGEAPAFLVEIERGDGREATVQVHAITGEVLSISWDD